MPNPTPARALRSVPTVLADAPTRPEKWRKTAIRAAWAVRDWHTLKACGEIDVIPEP